MNDNVIDTILYIINQTSNFIISHVHNLMVGQTPIKMKRGNMLLKRWNSR